MDGLDTPTRRQFYHSASPYLEARSWSWAAHSPQILESIFWCFQEVFAFIWQANFNSPNITLLPRRFCLHWAPVSHSGARGEEPDFFHNRSPISCHSLPHVGPSTVAFCPIPKGAFYWQFGLSCFFLGGLHNQAPLEDLKQTREISWSFFKGLVCQESAAPLRSCIHRELGKPSPGWQSGDVIWVLWTLHGSLCCMKSATE